MSDKPEAEGAAPAPVKSKKMLIIIVAVVVLALAIGGALFFISKKNAAAAEDLEDEPVAAQHEAPKGPPTTMPIDTMVVNLADPGGEKVAQVGVTLKLTDAHAIERIKPYLPLIRNDILLRISERTSTELLTREGKDGLAQAIFEDASKHFASEEEEGAKKKKKKKKDDKHGEGENPILGVLFSSFIVQ